ncbi:hypothetical protein Bca52824_067601 [Brassica carinata]|uniref:DIRP domain-containing protein n=1 Tax=Brassica carinata TaxID=52824 RepID=A0A8X7UD10_BRACI|nr:hypothetical protein Bca52824_067601 [Brassica carinata]
MAPAVRKSRSVNKRFTNEPSPRKDAGSSRKISSKVKMSDKLGPQWTKAELERFYDSYRKYGQDWRKVAAAIRNSRSVDMVEALFNMNKAYLSLPEGTASVAGLIAMMTDHYSVMEGSGSEGEGLDVPEAPRKQQKRKRAKPQLSDSREEDDRQQHPVASSDGCLKILKQARANGTHRRATGKRTPRVPVQTSRDDGEGATPPNKRARKQRDANDDVAAHFLALTLKDASRREGSPQVSESPNKRIEPSDNSPIKSWGKWKAQSCVRSSREKKLESDRDDTLLVDMEGVGEMEVPRKLKRVYKKRVRVEEAECNDSDDNGGACSATEGRRIKSKRRKAGVEASRGTYSPRSPKKRDNKLTTGDEFDALQALADLSASFLPGALMESESSAQLKEERIENDMDEKSSSPDDSHGEKADSEPDDSLLHAISAIGNAAYSRKPKSSRQPSTDCNAVPTEKLEPEPISGSSRRKRKPKKLWDETPAESTRKKSINKQELAQEDVNIKPSFRAKRSGQGPQQSKQLKAVKELEESTTSTSDKKISEMDVEVATKEVSDSGPASLHRSLQTGDKLSTSLSHPLARRRCIFEWFYSAIDHPWFAKMEFVDYLNHVGLGHIPRLTRLEWSVIKSSLGRPRRFSERFLQEERRNSNSTEGLPTDLARPLAVGNRVIAIHPKTREIHDGKILTVDHSQCNVLFDDLGVELVKDIDCMPSNPLEYMPEGLRRQVDKCLSIKKEAQQLRGNSNLGNVDFSMNPTLNQGDMIAPILHGKVLTNTSSGPHQTNQQNVINYSKGRETEIQRALAVQHASDEKAASSVKEGEDAIKMIQEALDMVGKHQPLRSSVVKHEEHANGGVEHHQNPSPSSDASKPVANNDFISQDGSEKNEAQMPSELVTSCVASWLMIQMCTERQYPPSDVAQLIDTAVTSLQPRCPQNLPIYREIQMCMGRIKTQILSLVPS